MSADCASFAPSIEPPAGIAQLLHVDANALTDGAAYAHNPSNKPAKHAIVKMESYKASENELRYQTYCYRQSPKHHTLHCAKVSLQRFIQFY